MEDMEAFTFPVYGHLLPYKLPKSDGALSETAREANIAEAFAMGAHPRLGKDSPIGEVPISTLGRIMEYLREPAEREAEERNPGWDALQPLRVGEDSKIPYNHIERPVFTKPYHDWFSRETPFPSMFAEKQLAERKNQLAEVKEESVRLRIARDMLEWAIRFEQNPVFIQKLEELRAEHFETTDLQVQLTAEIRRLESLIKNRPSTTD